MSSGSRNRANPNVALSNNHTPPASRATYHCQPAFMLVPSLTHAPQETYQSCALSLESKFKDKNVVDELVDHGAELTVRNTRGETAEVLERP